MHWLLPLAATWLVSVLRAGGVRAQAHTSQSLYVTLCTPGACRNGQCYVAQQTPRCVCETLYRGDACEFVDLEKVHLVVMGSMVVFQWDMPPRLLGYAFVYYESESPDLHIYKRDIHMRDSENTIMVGNLRGGHTLYRICIEDEAVASRTFRTQSLEELTNCVELRTRPDYNTLAGWLLAAMLTMTIVLLMYSQRDKIEILYFNSPVYIPKALHDSLASHDVTNMVVTSDAEQCVLNGTTSRNSNTSVR